MGKIRTRVGVGLAVATGLILGAIGGERATAGDLPLTRVAGLVDLPRPPVVLDELPRPLSRRDVELYRQIFALQERGRWQRARPLVRRLRNRLLLGHVLAQRYLHPTAYRASYEELRSWLAHYADHPEASRIYRLALRRRPAGAAAPQKPVPGYLGGTGQELSDPYRAGAGWNRFAAPVRKWLGRIRAAVSAGRNGTAERLLGARAMPRKTGALARDLARLLVARGLLASGDDREAYRLLEGAAERSGEEIPGLRWAAGLAAWRTGDRVAAARHFAALAVQPNTEGEVKAAAAFWAARALLTTGRPRRASHFLEIAAGASDGFYGLLAQAVLGYPIRFSWDEAGLRSRLTSLLIRFPGSRRALALAQVGRRSLVEAEIRKLAARARPRLLKALAALAESMQLPGAQMRVAQRLRRVDGRRHYGALFPTPDLRPAGGLRLDRALLYAFVRAESGFDPEAASPQGALGLMQILPATARLVERFSVISYDGARQLRDPAYNLAVGQAYLSRLLESEVAGRSLIHLALAYNAGVNRLRGWEERLARFRQDPLLYLESIPVAESRLYVKKILANLWAYRVRLGQQAPSLEALARNRWPVYVPLERAESYRYARSD